MLFQSFRKHVAAESLICKRDRVLLAVSGGIDSMVLMELFCRLSESQDLHLMVAHLNHMLRGKESDADEELVRAAAVDHGIPIEILRKRPKEGRNIQNSAREMRLKFFEDLAIRWGAGSVATAHHRDDQAETVLLHLLRGSGLKGLSGMTSISQFGKITMIRPLLPFSRDEIEAYARKRKISYRMDSSNLKTKYSRNSIRHEIIPILKRLNPKIVEHLSSMATRLWEDEKALGIIADESLNAAAIEEVDGLITFSREPVMPLPLALRYRVYLKAFDRASGSTKDLSADHLLKIDHIINSETKSGTYRLPRRWRFERRGDMLCLRLMKTACDR